MLRKGSATSDIGGRGGRPPGVRYSSYASRQGNILQEDPEDAAVEAALAAGAVAMAGLSAALRQAMRTQRRQAGAVAQLGAPGCRRLFYKAPPSASLVPSRGGGGVWPEIGPTCRISRLVEANRMVCFMHSTRPIGQCNGGPQTDEALPRHTAVRR